MSENEQAPAEQVDVDVEQDDDSAVTQPNPYSAGFGVTGKFPQDGNDADPMALPPAEQSDALEDGQPAGPSTDVPASESDQLDVPAEQNPDTA